MTDAEFYSLVVTVALITGIVFLAISMLLFFRLRIIKVIGDLTGRSAKQGVKKKNKEEVIKRKEQEMEVARLKEEKAAKKQKRNNRKTEKITNETTLLESEETSLLGSSETVVLEPEGSSETVVLEAAQIQGIDETTVLSSNETEVLTSDVGQTVPLKGVTEQLSKNDRPSETSYGKTTPLKADTEQLAGGMEEGSDMVIEDNITVVNTDVIIE